MVWQLFAKSKNHTLEETYMQLINEESVYEKAILRDLPKTYTDHEYFQGTEGQAALFNIVKAYSIYDTELGYSQGVSFIAGPLLLNVRIIEYRFGSSCLIDSLSLFFRCLRKKPFVF
jgi:hypothetical protein